MQMERKIMLEAMLIFVVSAVIYGLIGERNFAMLLFWNIFAYMLIEDFRYQTVDLRSVVLLILFSAAGAESLKKYLLALAIGLVIFRMLSLLTTKIYEATEVFVGKSIVRSGHGYLPSLGAGILIYLLLEKVFGVPECVSAVVTGYKEIFEFVWQVNELLVGLIIVFVGLWLMLEWRVRKAAKEGKEIVEGMATGDILVLGILGGVFYEKLFAVFFVSMLMQLAEIAYRNVEWGEMKS